VKIPRNAWRVVVAVLFVLFLALLTFGFAPPGVGFAMIAVAVVSLVVGYLLAR
jgi:hypothetical protein